VGTTKVEWAQKSWNPVTGCTKASPGCLNCYAERMAKRLAGRYGYPAVEPFAVTLHPDRLDEPRHWKKPSRVFVCSMGDLFHADVPAEYVDEVFQVMADCPQHTFLVLTKRPENIQEKLYGHIGLLGGGDFLPNVWFGVTAENQAAADARIPILLQTPAAKRFVSCEPLLDLVDLTSVEWPNKGGHRVDVLRGGYWCEAGYRGLGPAAQLGANRGGFTNHSDMETLDWVIVGGETGPGARPMRPVWGRSLLEQCKDAAAPFFFKSWGTAYDIPKERVRLLAGVEWNQYPEMGGGPMPTALLGTNEHVARMSHTGTASIRQF
jgi:protein gp37